MFVLFGSVFARPSTHACCPADLKCVATGEDWVVVSLPASFGLPRQLIGLMLFDRCDNEKVVLRPLPVPVQRARPTRCVMATLYLGSLQC